MAARTRSSPQIAVMRLTSLAQMRVIANPLRLRLLDAFVPEPRTTMQVARLLGESPTRLYRHVDALFRAGFLERRGTRKNRGTTETYYQATAGHFEADPGLFAKRGRGGGGFGRTLGRVGVLSTTWAGAGIAVSDSSANVYEWDGAPSSLRNIWTGTSGSRGC